MTIIDVKGLTKEFQLKEKDPGLAGSLRSLYAPRYRSVAAVKGVSFSVERGETLAFIGPNGAGKSTTIKMLTGILYPSGGSATVLGLVPWEQRQRLAYEIGSVFGQRSQLWYHLPPQDTFTLLAKIYDLDETVYQRRLGELIELFDLTELLKVPVRKMSLGQRMRCEIAASLLHGPKVIFLDEPTIGLDVVAKQKIRDLIRHLNREEGITVFLTSHDTGDIEQLCKRVMVINHGEVIMDGSVNDLKYHYLQKKIIGMRLETTIKEFDMPGVEVLKHKDVGLKLRVDTSLTPIDSILVELMRQTRILDITINDPPLDEIITAIYQQPGRGDNDAAKPLNSGSGSLPSVADRGEEDGHGQLESAATAAKLG